MVDDTAPTTASLLASLTLHRAHPWRRGIHGPDLDDVAGRVGDLAGDPLPFAGLQPGSANCARLYDHLLGGKDAYREDREAADLIEQLVPGVGLVARENRRLLANVVQTFVGQGIDQIIDVGSGLPTTDNVHEIAEAADPRARTVYVDHDEVVVAHARALVWRHHQARVVHADLCDVDAVLTSEAVTDLLDLTRPVLLLFSAVLHAIDDEQDPPSVITAYAERLAPGSVIVVSHVTTPFHLGNAAHMLRGRHPRSAIRGAASAGATAPPSSSALPVATPAAVAEALRLYRSLVGTMVPRSAPEVAALLAGLPLDPPGVAPGEWWHDSEVRVGGEPAAPFLVAVARVI